MFSHPHVFDGGETRALSKKLAGEELTNTVATLIVIVIITIDFVTSRFNIYIIVKDSI